MAVTEELRLLIRAEADQAIREAKKYEKEIGKARKENQQFEKSSKNVTKSLVKAAAAIGAAVVAAKALIDATRKAIDAYRDQEMAVVRMEAALAATGGQVGITAGEMRKFAEEMADTTLFTDQTIIAAQGVLTTFTQIGQETFPRAIRAAADMSTMFGQDLQASVVQLGKALNDPIIGVSALREIGISFNETQKETIRTMVEANDTMGAQAVILDELNREFGGVAEKAGTTATGAIDQLGKAFNELREIQGRTTAEGMRPFVAELTNMLNTFIAVKNQAIELQEVLSAGSQQELTAQRDIVARTVEQVQLQRERVQLLEEETDGFSGAYLKAAEDNLKELQELLRVRRAHLMVLEAENDEQKEAAEAAEAATIAAIASDRAKAEHADAVFALVSGILESEKTELDVLREQLAVVQSINAGGWEPQRKLAEEILAARIDTLEAERDYLDVAKETTDELDKHEKLELLRLMRAEAIVAAAHKGNELTEAQLNALNAIAAALQKYKDDLAAAKAHAEEWASTMQDVQRTFVNFAAAGALDVLESLGAAFAASAEGADAAGEAIKDALNALRDQLPNILLQAGLAVLRVATTKAEVFFGVGLLAAAGVSAVIKGFRNASDTDDVASTGDGSSSSSSSSSASRSISGRNIQSAPTLEEGNTIITVNVRGSVISEQELFDRIESMREAASR